MAQDSTSKKVDGFSRRFNRFLDHFGLPSYGRYTEGAAITGKTVTSFKEYCCSDTAPRTTSALVSMVDEFIKRRPTRFASDAETIAAWLLFSERVVKNPLENAEPSSAEIMRLAGICNVVSADYGFTFTDLQESIIDDSINQLYKECAAYGADIMSLNSDSLPSGIAKLAHALIATLAQDSKTG